MRPIILVSLSTAALALGACGSSGGDEPSALEKARAGADASTSAGETSKATPAGPCKQVDAPKPRSGETSKPPASLPAGKTYDVRFDTSCGSFTVRLDTKEDPKTAANLGTLAKRGYFDGLGFHRVVPDFVVQGGDPAGDGSGGPGYSVVEKPPAGTRYTRGIVAMAKAGDDPAGASGSQFFVVTSSDAGLPADYAVAGKVTSGLDTVDAISALGSGDGPPSQPVVIDKATLVAK